MPQSGLIKPAQSKHPTFASLTYRDYRFLWFGIISMMAGLQMQGIARGYFVYDLTSSPLILGLVSSGFAFPMLGFALFGGALADRFKKKKIIQACQALGSLTAAYIAFAISTGRISWVHLFASSIINGFIFAFMVPARTALIPQLVGDRYLSNAFALSAAAMSSTTLLAPAIAGNLYNWLGADGVYVIIAALQGGAVVLTGFVKKDERPESPESKTAILKEIGSALKYIRANSIIIVLILLSISTALLAMPFRSFLPVYIVDVFSRGPDALGILVSAMGVGSIFGSLFVATLGRKRRGAMLLSGGLISALCLGLAAIFPNFIFVAVAMVFMGIGDAFRRSLTMALIMETTDKAYQGRVSSVYTMNFGLMPLGTLPAGIITQLLGVRAATGMLSIALLAVCMTILLTQPALRKLR